MKKRKILKLQKTKLRGKCKIEETAKKREIWKLQKIIKKSCKMRRKSENSETTKNSKLRGKLQNW